MNAGNAQNQAQLNSEIQNAYETFGSNVDLGALATKLGMTQADLQGVLSPDIQKLAQENTDAGLSTQARLDQQNKQATRSLMASLNAKGQLHSGEAGYQLDQLNTGYRQAQSDSYQKLLGYLDQYQQGYLSAVNQNTGNLTNAISSAATRQAGLNQGSAGASAQFDHVDARGAPVYRGPDGSLYGSDGQPYVPTPQAPAAAPGITLPEQLAPGQRPLVGHAYAA